MKTESFSVPAISCQHCVNAITDEVGALEGVGEVQVDLASKTVSVAASETVTREAITAAIQEAGYDVSPFSPTIALS